MPARAPTASRGPQPINDLALTAVQHQLVNRAMLAASESRGQMHEAAWSLLGVLLLCGIIALVVFGWFILSGVSRDLHLVSEPRRPGH